ncbi:hypothetical protein [Sulfurisphaera tokodaii]|uniref:Uncharacterized protein n=1 Tax=Sulfurisphaera tokodaii TaxID=111955 RepID=A0A832TIM0_9CREN|nr:hypothetical protein [Sulfurisphaera tokodaii]HII74851.1 hypothetical protein [Sulfurisphaera tokodaii]
MGFNFNNRHVWLTQDGFINVIRTLLLDYIKLKLMRYNEVNEPKLNKILKITASVKTNQEKILKRDTEVKRHN